MTKNQVLEAITRNDWTLKEINQLSHLVRVLTWNKHHEIRFKVPKGSPDVHTDHCCIVHGCKFGDDDCSVFTQKKRQEFDCEECIAEIEQG